MARHRPFRFAVQGRSAASRDDWLTKAGRVEELGYDTLSVPDHLVGNPNRLSTVTALAAAAAVTTTLRLGSFVFANDFRHPAVLAQEAASLDRLSDGRLELGIGAGWMRAEYEAAGIPFDPAPVRIARLAEAIGVIKALFAGGAVTVDGDHYRLSDLALAPTPVQRPHPPILVGGGGRRILEVSARHADIVGLDPRSRPDGTLDEATVTARATAQKMEWIREAAGPRFDALEINVFVYAVEETGDPTAVADRLAADFGLPAAEVLASPHTLIGSIDQMVDRLQERRDTFGISYVTVGEDLMDPLAPVVARLRGQ